MTKKTCLAGLLAVASVVGAYFVAPLIVNKIQKLFDREGDDKKRIAHLWYTLQELGEISDPRNIGPDPELLQALRAISDVEFNLHRELWEKHVKGTEAKFALFLDKVEVVVKIKHRPTYDLLALKEGGTKLVASSKVSKSWVAGDLPLELTGVAHKLASKKSGSENVPFLPYAMIEKWSYQEHGKPIDPRFPAIDLSVPQNREVLAKIASEKGSNELAMLAQEHSGLLVPTFEAGKSMSTCFGYETGLVEVRESDEKCKPLVQKYMAAAKASANLDKKLAIACNGDLIRFSKSNVDLDPCASPGEFTTKAFCDRSIDAFIRKLTQDPNAKEESHRTYLLNNCKEEVSRLKRADRLLIEGPPDK